MRARRLIVTAAGLALLTHGAGNPAPLRWQAAVDPGLVGATVLYTWTMHRQR